MDKTTRLLRRATRQLIRKTFRDCGVECQSTRGSILAIVYAQHQTWCERYNGMMEVEHSISQGKLKVHIHNTCKVPEAMKEQWRRSGYMEPWLFTELELADPNCFPTLATLINTVIPPANRTRPHYKYMRDRAHIKTRDFIPDDPAARDNPKLPDKPKLRPSQSLATRLVRWLIWRFDLREFEKDVVQVEPALRAHSQSTYYLTQAIRRFCKISIEEVDIVYKLASDIKEFEVNSKEMIAEHTKEVINYG